MLSSRGLLKRLWGDLQVRSGRDLCQRIARQIYREWHAYGLIRDLRVPFKSPSAKLPIAVRLLTEQDIPRLFSVEQDTMTRQARLEQARRIALIAERLSTPYVAVDSTSNQPCFLQWMFTARSNDFVQRHFRGRFPLIADNEALLEYAFTPPTYRGRGIMPAAMSLIAE